MKATHVHIHIGPFDHTRINDVSHTRLGSIVRERVGPVSQIRRTKDAKPTTCACNKHK